MCRRWRKDNSGNSNKLEESARGRHDFRHIIGMLDEMLCVGDIEAARDYLTAYRIAMPKNEVVRYCEHTALNVLLNYYAEATHQNAIRLRIVIDLPDRVPLSDSRQKGLLSETATYCRCKKQNLF